MEFACNVGKQWVSTLGESPLRQVILYSVNLNFWQPTELGALDSVDLEIPGGQAALGICCQCHSGCAALASGVQHLERDAFAWGHANQLAAANVAPSWQCMACTESIQAVYVPHTVTVHLIGKPGPGLTTVVRMNRVGMNLG